MLDFSFATVDEVCKALGARLKAQRLVREWTQLELANRAKLSKGTVQNLENHGVGSLDSLVKLVSTLGLMDELQTLFELRVSSIAQMAAAEQGRRRQRAPRTRKP